MIANPQAPSHRLTLPPVRIDPAALAAATAWAEASYRSCEVCAERCGVDRLAGPAGRCGLGREAHVYKEYLHLGEERLFVPGHAIYLSGCSFRCAFCSDDAAIRRPLATGVSVSPRALAARVAERRAAGATNVNFVGGVPDVNVLYILETLAHVPEDTHVVWNTNLWTTPEVIARLAPIIGTWLVDHKFGADACALKLAGVRAYREHLDGALRTLMASAGPIDQTTGQPRGRPFVFIRHLLMPGHLECCTVPVLEHLAAAHPELPVNLMTGYHPYRLARAGGPMARAMPRAETAQALAAFFALPFAHHLVDGVEVDPSTGEPLSP